MEKSKLIAALLGNRTYSQLCSDAWKAGPGCVAAYIISHAVSDGVDVGDHDRAFDVLRDEIEKREDDEIDAAIAARLDPAYSLFAGSDS